MPFDLEDINASITSLGKPGIFIPLISFAVIIDKLSVISFKFKLKSEKLTFKSPIFVFIFLIFSNIPLVNTFSKNSLLVLCNESILFIIDLLSLILKDLSLSIFIFFFVKYLCILLTVESIVFKYLLVSLRFISILSGFVLSLLNV